MKTFFKFLICLLLIFNCLIFFSCSYAKYVFETTKTVAKLKIDRYEPQIELVDITTSNTKNPNIANGKDSITAHIRLTEKNIYKNDINIHNIIVLIDGTPIEVAYTKFRLLSINSSNDVRLYEVIFTHIYTDGSLSLMIPEGTVQDKSGLKNSKKIFPTSIRIDNN